MIAATGATDTYLWNANTGAHLPPIASCGAWAIWSSDSKSIACVATGKATLYTVALPRRVVATAPAEQDTQLLSTRQAIWLWNPVHGTEWATATSSYPLTLTQLGSGKQLTVTLPGIMSR